MKFRSQLQFLIIFGLFSFSQWKQTESKELTITEDVLSFKDNYCNGLEGAFFYQADLLNGGLLEANLQGGTAKTSLLTTSLIKGLINNYNDVGSTILVRGGGSPNKPSSWTVEMSNSDDFKIAPFSTTEVLNSESDFEDKAQSLHFDQNDGQKDIVDTEQTYTIAACRAPIDDQTIKKSKFAFYRMKVLQKPKKCKEKNSDAVICQYFNFRESRDKTRFATVNNQQEEQLFTPYFDCELIEKTEINNSPNQKQSKYKLITIQSQIFFGGDLVYYISRKKQQSSPIPLLLRGGIGSEYLHIADQTVVDMELKPSGTLIYDAVVKNMKKLSDSGQDFEDDEQGVDITKEQQDGGEENKINEKDYYQFNGCGVYDNENKELIGPYKLQYHVTPAGGECDCEKCCRTGAFFGTQHGLVGCMKKNRMLREQAAVSFKMHDQFLNGYLKSVLELKKDNPQYQELVDGIQKDPIIKEHWKNYAKAKQDLEEIDQCVNCNALSRQFYKLWNHDKWLDSFSRDKDQQFNKREDIGDFNGWDRTDPNMFAVCDVCSPNPKGPTKTSCENIPLEKDRIKEKHLELGYSPKIFADKKFDDIFRPLSQTEKDKTRNYRRDLLSRVNVDTKDEVLRRAGLLSSGGQASSTINSSEENFKIDKRNGDAFDLENSNQITKQPSLDDKVTPINNDEIPSVIDVQSGKQTEVESGQDTVNNGLKQNVKTKKQFFRLKNKQ